NEIIGVTPLVDLPYDPAPIAFGLNILVAKTSIFLEYLEQLKEEHKIVSVENVLKKDIEHSDIKVKGYEYTGYLKPIEDIPSYYDANMDMLIENNLMLCFIENLLSLLNLRIQPLLIMEKDRM